MGKLEFDTQKDTRTISEFLKGTVGEIKGAFNTLDKSRTVGKATDVATDGNQIKTVAIAGGIGLLIGGILAWSMKA